jgi:hypothetical protein
VAEGIRHGDEVAKAKFLIGDPSYFPKDKIQATGRFEEGDGRGEGGSDDRKGEGSRRQED